MTCSSAVFRKASAGKDNGDRRSIRSGKSTGNSAAAVKAKQRLQSRSGGAGPGKVL